MKLCDPPHKTKREEKEFVLAIVLVYSTRSFFIAPLALHHDCIYTIYNESEKGSLPLRFGIASLD